MAASRGGSAGLGRWLNARWLHPFGMLALLIVAWDLLALTELAKTGLVDVHTQSRGD